MPRSTCLTLPTPSTHVRGTLVMASTNVPDSATLEFFINTALVDALVAAPCNLSPVNFDPAPPLPASRDCVPVPNLVISGALQTQ